ncbi:hypothetical protein [Mesorhizobium caraganae]|nr:hypothetical protein [Mesorhizobium caraganae]
MTAFIGRFSKKLIVIIPHSSVHSSQQTKTPAATLPCAAGDQFKGAA